MKNWFKGSLLAIGAFLTFGATSSHAIPTLNNGSFETPDVGGFGIVTNGTPGLFWQGGPAPNNLIDLYDSGTIPGVNAFQGNQYAEVQRGNITDTISQTVTGFSPGSFVTFSFAHAARNGTGNNVLNFKIVEGGTSTVLYSSNFSNNIDSGSTNRWILNQGISSLRTNSTSVDFIFTGVSTGVPGQPGNGNFIDAVTAGEAVPGPLPLLGAATAFSYSRKIRRRIKKVQP